MHRALFTHNPNANKKDNNRLLSHRECWRVAHNGNYLYYQLIIMIGFSTLRNTALTGLNQVFGRGGCRDCC